MSAEEIHALAERYCRGELSAEEYYAQVEVWAKEAVAAEVADMQRRRTKR